MKKIYKYDLHERPGQLVKMPKNAKILKVDYQRYNLKLWAIVDTDNPITDYCVEIFGTGFNCNTEGKYINTVFIGSFVWHIFVDELETK